MANEPLFSVIVPIYNIEEYVEKCIDSILAQTFEDFELILVDDGSTDRSGEICDCYARKDCKIKVIHKENGGLVSARKSGTDLARGQYIVPIDGDDWIDEDRLEAVAKEIKSEAVDAIYLGGVYFEYPTRRELKCELGEYKVLQGDECGKEVIKQMYRPDNYFVLDVRFNQWNWVVKSEILKNIQSQIDDRIFLAEDMVCILGCLCNAKKIVLMNQPGYHYNQCRDAAMTWSTVDYFELEKMIYSSLDKILGGITNFKEIYTVLTAQIMLNDYKIFNRKYDFLFPYPKTREMKKLVVYGAGKYGRKLVESLLMYEGYELVDWVDKNMAGQLIHGININDVLSLKDMDFDGIVIAAFYYDVEMQIKQELIQEGIPEYKILTKDADTIKMVTYEFLAGK